MRPALAALAFIAVSTPALAVTGGAPPAAGDVGRAIVMLTDENGDLCSATALAPELVLTAAHCVIGPHKRAVKVYQTGQSIAVRGTRAHPRFNVASYAASRATADVALVKLAAPLPAIVAPAELAPPRRVAVGETLTIAGFGVTVDRTAIGLGIPREATLTVTGKPGSLQIRLVDPKTRDRRAGLGACVGDSGGPAFETGADGKRRIIAIVSWTTAPDDEEGCGGLTGLTPLILYRDWIVETAKTYNSPLP
ncbi:MAG TPA: trypsin-like serine protease [Pseudolabrys sp.]|nr:trypsin-like serine protease [Pseudolabrys sp.]